MLRKVLLLFGWLGLLQPAWAAGLQLDGPVEQGGMLMGHAPPGSQVRYDGRAVRLSPQGVFLIGFGRDDKGPAHIELITPDGAHLQRTLAVKQRQYRIQRIDGLPPRKVTPKPEDLARIKADIAAVHHARALDDARTDFLSGFIWPATGPISGVYGSQRILNGKPRWPHFGVDIAAPKGTPVVAPADGMVTLVAPDMFYSGNTLIVDHGHGLSSSFLHLSRILVKEGQRVHQGQTIAEIGASGRVTGAHLDWRMNLVGKRIDPQLLVGPMPVQQAAKK
jgi:murein DD-endopeptidase MepM/ murein hydrolase activator NlpD